MREYHVCYGSIIVRADNEEEALKIAKEKHNYIDHPIYVESWSKEIK